jgi:hypothetical protein
MGRALTGFGLGMGLMYFLDPDRGRRRRALVRDQLVRWANTMRDAVEVVSRDLSHRACGVAAEAKALFTPDAATDARIEARVRSALGRVTSHPRALEVHVEQGRVTLSGPVLASEVENVVETTRSVRGVRGVRNLMDVHQEPGNHPALQGGATRPGVRSELFQERWSPTTRLLVGLAGGLLAMKLLRRPGLAGLAVGAIGTGLAAKAIADSEAARDRAEGWRRETHQEAGSSSLSESWASP